MSGPPQDNPEEDRSSVAIASVWASRIMTVSFEMVVPGLVGVWLDRQLGTVVLFALAGFVLGSVTGVFHLVRIAKVTDFGTKNQNGKS